MDTNQNIIIRHAAIDDIDKLYALERMCSLNPWSRGGLLGELTNPAAIFLVSDNDFDNQIIGFICSQLVAGELQILEVAIHPDCRNRGCGEALLRRLMAEAAQSRAVRALLEVRASNRPAIRLYEKCGFVTDGIRKKYYQDGEDAVLMSKTICG